LRGVAGALLKIPWRVSRPRAANSNAGAKFFALA
jgi:hypothetical protein